jgi:hypothetical protein
VSAVVGINVRTVGRGTQVLSFSGQDRAEVEAQAIASWKATDPWRRPATPPLARLVNGLWVTAFIVEDCE